MAKSSVAWRTDRDDLELVNVNLRSSKAYDHLVLNSSADPRLLRVKLCDLLYLMHGTS